jgi:hypothetical protein
MDDEISIFNETESDEAINIYIEQLEENIDDLKKQIEQLKKRNYTLKSLLLCKFPAYVSAVIDCL